MEATIYSDFVAVNVVCCDEPATPYGYKGILAITWKCLSCRALYVRKNDREIEPGVVEATIMI